MKINRSKIFRQFASPIIRSYLIELGLGLPLILLLLLGLQPDDVLLVCVLGTLLLGLVVDAHVALFFLPLSLGLRVVLLLAGRLQVHP